MVPRKFHVVSFVMRSIEFTAAVLILMLALFYKGGLAMVHPVLMLIGPLVLTGKGTVSYKTPSGTRNSKILAHLTLHFLAVCLSLIGLSGVWKFPSGKGDDNVLHLHYIYGLATLLLFVIQLAFGFVTFWFPGGWSSSDWGRLTWQHILGSLIYIFAVLSCGFGSWESLKLLEARQISPCPSFEGTLMIWLCLLMLALFGLEYLRLGWEDEFLRRADVFWN